MKKALLSLVLCALSLPVLAGPDRYGSRLVIEPRWQAHHHGHGHWQRNGGLNWVVPAIIGSAIIYSSTRPEPIIVQQPIMVQQPVPVLQGQNCSPWTETQSSDGSITRTRTCNQ